VASRGLFGVVQAFAAFAVAQPILASRDLDVPLTDPTALRGVALAALATAGVALLGLGAGMLVRHTAGAVSAVLIMILGIPIVGLFFPRSWSTVTRYRFCPRAAARHDQPTALQIGRGYDLGIFYCPTSFHHPYKTAMQ